MPWTEERKAAIAKALTWDYTSSDESDMSEDENGHTCLKGYIVKKLSWEKTTLRNAKKALDDAYIKSLPPRVRANVLGWRVHHTPSKRGPPPNALQWAVRILTPETPPATPAVTRRLETPAARPTPTRTDNPLRTPRMSQSPVTPRTTPAVTRRLETPAARPTPTRTDNPLRTPRMSQSPVTPRTTPAVTRRLETPAARPTPTHTDNPLRTPRMSQSPVTPRTTPAVTRPLETPTARAAPTRTDNPLRTPTCTSQSPVTPRTTLSTIDSPVEQRARGTLETPRIPARIAAPRTIPTQT